MGTRFAAYALAGLVLVVSSSATAQSGQPLAESLTGEAKGDYEAGKLLFADGDFAGASIKFKRAYEASRDPRLLWNMAASEKGLRHYGRSVELINLYVDRGHDLVTDADRKEAQALLQTLESFTCALTIEVSEPGAEVLVDGAVVGTSPLVKPIVVDLGTRRVVARKKGFRESSQTVDTGGREAKVVMKLVIEVHEGHLTVSAQPDGKIVLDNETLGVGHASQTVKSGGHTLRVVAAGMKPYQSEVTVGDGEDRTINVPALERNPSIPIYRGLEGRIDLEFTDAPGTVAYDGAGVNVGFGAAVRAGYAWDWYAVEGFAIFQLAVGGATLVKGLFGAALRATSKTDTLRVTGSLGAGAVGVFVGGQPNNNPNPPAYGGAVFVGDVGLLLGGTPPGPKLFAGVQAWIEVASGYGAFFFIGPALGVGFGH